MFFLGLCLNSLKSKINLTFTFHLVESQTCAVGGWGPMFGTKSQKRPSLFWDLPLAGISSQVFPHLSPSRASVGRISIGCFCQLDITLLHIRQIIFSCKNSSSNIIRFSLPVTTWDVSAKLVPYFGEMKFEYLGVPSMELLSFPGLV